MSKILSLTAVALYVAVYARVHVRLCCLGWTPDESQDSICFSQGKSEKERERERRERADIN